MCGKENTKMLEASSKTSLRSQKAQNKLLPRWQGFFNVTKHSAESYLNSTKSKRHQEMLLREINPAVIRYKE